MKEETAVRWRGRSHFCLELLGQQSPGGPAITGGFRAGVGRATGEVTRGGSHQGARRGLGWSEMVARKAVLLAQAREDGDKKQRWNN